MKTIYKLLIATLLPLAGMAQSITLEQCREMALENSYKLKSAQLKIDKSEDIAKAYRANNLPKVSLSAGYLYSTASISEVIEGGYLPTFVPDATTGGLKPNIVGAAPDGSPIFGSYAFMPDMKFDFETGSVFTAGVQIAQPIYIGGKIAAATKLSKLGVDVASLEKSLSESDVIISADQAFFAYLKVEEMNRAADAYRKVVDELHRQVASLLKSGMCTKNDLLRVQVEVNKAELQQLKAKNGLILARMNLCYIIGLPVSTTSLEVSDSFDMQQGISSELDITSRKEFALLEKSVEAKELEVKLAQSDFRPSLTAMANYGYTNGMKLNGSTLLSSPSFTGGVSLNIPLFHWGEGRRKVSAARREAEIAANTQADLVQKMTLELMQAINTYNEAQAQVALTEQTVEQTKENLRQSNKQYNAGMETLSTLLEAQALWQKAMSDLTEAKANQRIAYVNYCRCRGEVF